MSKPFQTQVFQPVSAKNNNQNYISAPKKSIENLAVLSDDQKENSNNQLFSVKSAHQMSTFFSQSDDSLAGVNKGTPLSEKTKRSGIFRNRGKEGLLCESMRGSIDEAFLATQDSLDTPIELCFSSSIDERPSINEAVYLMRSFSTDEMNAVRTISQNNIRLTNSSMMGAKKLSLINPSAMKGGVSSHSNWQLMSPTDRNLLSPSKALKRKYQSRSHEELVFDDV